jgi:hypothetical protein
VYVAAATSTEKRALIQLTCFGSASGLELSKRDAGNANKSLIDQAFYYPFVSSHFSCPAQAQSVATASNNLFARLACLLARSWPCATFFLPSTASRKVGSDRCQILVALDLACELVFCLSVISPDTDLAPLYG